MGELPKPKYNRRMSKTRVRRNNLIKYIKSAVRISYQGIFILKSLSVEL